jgi:hypothetical protein
MKNFFQRFVNERFGLVSPTPSQSVLSKIGMTKKRFTQLLTNANCADLTAEELIRIMLWWNVEIGDGVRELVDVASVEKDFKKAGNHLKAHS